jgi:competence protein ComEC
MVLVYLTAAWVAGIAVARFASLPIYLWCVLAALPVGLLVIWWRDSFLRGLHLCLLFFLLGALRYTLAVPAFDEQCRLPSGEGLKPLACLNDHGPILLEGEVVDPPEVRDRIVNVRISVTRARPRDGWQNVSGRALVQAPRETDMRYGDLLQVYAEPATPSESPDFSYKEYLARQGIHSLVRTYGGGIKVLSRDRGDPFHTVLYRFRSHGIATIYAMLPDPAASLLAGILLGDDSGMPSELTDAFSATNTAHIIAISGFNIAVVAGVLSKLGRRLLGAHRTTLFVILGLTIYTLLVGASASVVRAAVMGVLSVIALHYNRPNTALISLAFAAWAMTVLNPLTLYDLGFQLSFLATLGLILFVPGLTRVAETFLAKAISAERARQVVGVLGDSLIVTMAAEITTLPLILFTFHRLSLVGLATNFLILPIQPQVMLVGGLATLTGMVLLPLGQVIAWVAWAFLEWTILGVQVTAALPFASVEVGRFDVIWPALYYAILLGITRVNWTELRARVSLRPALVLGVLLVAGVWLWNLGITLPDGKTHVEFLDAAGPATLVRTPRGARILVDGGATPSALLAALGDRMPFWDRSLDLVVLTHADDEHLAGLLPALERYPVRQVIQVAPPQKPNAAYLKWNDLLTTKQVSTLLAQPDVQLVLDRDISLEILPSGETSDAAVVRLVVGEVAFLFAGSAEPEEQAAVVASGANVASTVMVTPRKLDASFLEAAGPRFAIVFVGQGARDKPAGELLTALSSATVLRTDEHGTVEMITEGQTLAIKTER